MKFELPVASRQRLDELLEYLGDRAEDFKKCFDIESEWCWKYADLVLRGITNRVLDYGERHHITPYVFYKLNGYTCRRDAKRVCSNNMTILSYDEHVFAHFYAFKAAQQIIKGGMARAFITMINVRNKGTHKMTISEETLFSIIDDIELDRIRGMIPQIKTVSDEGRTHRWEDPLQYQRDYIQKNIGKVREYKRNWKKNNPDKVRENTLNRIHKNPEHFRELRRNNRNKDLNHSRQVEREWEHKNKPKRLAQKAANYAKNPEKFRKKSADWRKNNPEKRKLVDKKQYDKNVAKGLRKRKDPVTGKTRWIPANDILLIIKPVGKYTSDGLTLLEQYPSISSAAAANGIAKGTLRGWVKGLHKGNSSYVFKYIE